LSYPYYDCVTRAHAELTAEGQIKPRATQDEVEQDKGLLTRRAAWYVYSERDPSHGLLAKTSGNNSQGYSVDWILENRGGDGWDIATDDGTQALPLNGDAHGPDPARIPDWRQPTAELAHIGTTPEPGPTPPPEETILDQILDTLDSMAAEQAKNTAEIMAHDDANTQRILDTIDSIKTQVEESLQKALVLILAKRRRNPDEPVP